MMKAMINPMTRGTRFRMDTILRAVQQQQPRRQRSSPMHYYKFAMAKKRGSSQLFLSTSSFSSNEQLVQKRLAVAKAKKEAKQKSLDETKKRNLRIKKVVEQQQQQQQQSSDGNNNNNEFQVPPLYAVKVSVCEELRNELHLSGRERRGRVFIEIGSPATKSLKSLKFDIHAFFRALKKSTFVLSATLPEIAPDGSIVNNNNAADAAPDDTDTTTTTTSTTTATTNNSSNNSWKIETDEDVVKTFAMADEFFTAHNNNENNNGGDINNNNNLLKRPSIVIQLTKDPNAPPPPPPPSYLENMEDPKQSSTMSMISFYSFPPQGIDDPEEFASNLRKTWKPFGALGRIYVANEGVNAQMSIPTNVLNNFIECCHSIPELGSFMENGVNIDPKPLTMEEFASAGTPVKDGKPAPPFKNLHVRVRQQIVADGLDKPLDWQSAGYDMPPMEWHQKLKEAKQQRERDDSSDGDGEEEAATDLPLILDCRNDYETNIGRFEGAEPLETTNFRDSWDVLDERLKNVPKDSPIMTYCTGGIRCVKVGAYLTQELGFTNVSRLAGGIIAYDRTVEKEAKDEEPMFRGANMVFDGRLGRQITDDKLGECITCGAKTNLISNCQNVHCHKRMTQCESCRTKYHATCSDACKQQLVKNQQVLPVESGGRLETAAEGMQQVDSEGYSNLDEYSTGHSSPPPSLYREIEHNTQAHLPSGSHMVSGFEQGRLLTNLASMTREGRILELGTFTGYATACFLEGAANVASATGLNTSGSRDSGPYVLSMERDQRAFNLASAHLKVMSESGVGEEGAEAACALRSSNVEDAVMEIEDDLVSVVYDDAATCDLLKVSDALATLEEMAKGKTSTMEQPPAPFDLVFIDADKTRLMEYVEACLDGDRVLKKGGMIVVDNVLWKGLVLDAAGSAPLLVDEEGAEEAELKKNRRARKLAGKMHRFNSAVVKDPRCEVLLLQVRDGLSMIRKK